MLKVAFLAARAYHLKNDIVFMLKNFRNGEDYLIIKNISHSAGILNVKFIGLHIEILYKTVFIPRNFAHLRIVKPIYDYFDFFLRNTLFYQLVLHVFRDGNQQIRFFVCDSLKPVKKQLHPPLFHYAACYTAAGEHILNIVNYSFFLI